jgi:hypothetical protein
VRLDADRLSEEISKLDQSARKIVESSAFMTWMKDPAYGRAKLLSEALAALREYKEERDSRVQLREGMTYYVARKIGSRIVGQRLTYMGEGRHSSWVPFDQSARKLKIMEVLRHGSDEDFSQLYHVLADGRPLEAGAGFCEEHLVESSEAAMRAMEAYCDSRWEGPWPWELPAPKKLKDQIKENRMMRQQLLAEARGRFNRIYQEVMEGEVEKAQVILAGRDIVTKIDGMIQDLGKLSAEMMTTFKDQARTEYGEAAAQQLEGSSNQKIGAAIDALGDLKSAIDTQLSNMEGGIAGQPPAAAAPPAAGDDAGVPPPADRETTGKMQCRIFGCFVGFFCFFSGVMCEIHIHFCF